MELVATKMNLDLGIIATSIISAIVVGMGSSWLAMVRFKAMDTERERHWARRLDQISQDVEGLEKSSNVTVLALLQQSVQELIKRFDQLDVYTEKLKHLHIDPLEREVGKLRQKVDEMKGE